jgi:hypothetical protein
MKQRQENHRIKPYVFVMTTNSWFITIYDLNYQIKRIKAYLCYKSSFSFSLMAVVKQ